MKLGVFIAGKDPVVVRVVRGQRREGALVYGSNAPVTEVTFRPCAGRRSTGWAGGLSLKRRRPLTVEISIEGEAATRRLTLG